MSGTLTTRARPPVVLADLASGTLVRDAALIGGAAGLVGALAQISVHLSFTPVPITGQTLGVLLAGTALGWKRGTAAMAVYGLAGLAGVPWFAGHESGYVGASFGYILGFVLCAALCGFLAERRADRTVRTSVPAMIAGEAVMYAAGVAWLGAYLHVGPARAIALGLTPFLAGDAIKAAIAAVALPGAWKLARREGSPAERDPG
ncbi:MAG TPA: biotin transporter BioY [Streptosporangiaceae bacterium]|nr:biotin transporter BioY [Streptosporangiaceae bacterium]